MTLQEAIQFLKETIAGCHILRDRQLRAVCEASINALEKQIPKKIKTEYITRELKRYRCPACNQHYFDISHKYCHFCGQALDWSDTE